MTAGITPFAGHPAIKRDRYLAGSDPAIAQGALLATHDDWWGAGEYIYAKASGTIAAFSPCTLVPGFDGTLKKWVFEAAALGNTAAQARSVAVAQGSFADGEFGWFQVYGVTPIKSTAALNAGVSVGVTAAGAVGASSAGKTILGCSVVAKSDHTVAKAGCVAANGSTVLTVPSADGWFEGAALSGTGVGSSALVTKIDPSNRIVHMSVASSAQINGTVTATYNDGTIHYNVVAIDRPHLMGTLS